ncbi:DUF7059 domain-containing protein [Ruicaihuangia caeni]|uniref:Methyltransferase n=1 Tax=Ruicaihuangia caeni TaxID=3042517 RepID=A0AAW6T6N0_9MICO|nr:methyltransferase [Klugiella sp. YN-L-19]MDI2097750.1 methyltransferase [Klugiella sp. YN-L-19]
MSEPHPPTADAASIALLARDLEAATFSVDALSELWGPAADGALFRGHRAPALRAIASKPRPLATLATVFVLGLPVRETELAEALPALGVGGAITLGLVARAESGFVTPSVDLRPYSFVDERGSGAWWIASDLGELAREHELDESHVLGVGGASTTLTGLMVQRPVASALDLGTGCGIQAMHLSRHAEHVVATDISARALAFARFNAMLNGIRSIEFRQGSLFEPVEGERFEQIVSNPPFVITPRRQGVPEYEYRDGGLVGDDIVRHMLVHGAEHLADGGVAQFLGNWEYHGGASAFDRVEEWVANAAIDLWVVEREALDPAEYAETWIRDGGTRPGPVFDDLERRWLEDFELRGVSQVGLGYITMRRPRPAHSQEPHPGQRLRRFERLQHQLGETVGGLGAHLLQSLVAHDALSRLDDDSVAALQLRVAASVTEERHYWPGDDDPTAMLLRQGSGFGRAIPLDTALAATIGACDGSLSVAAICSAIGQLLDVNSDAVLASVLPRLREAIFTGFLELPDAATVHS